MADKDGFGNSIYIKSFISHNIDFNGEDDNDNEDAEVEEDVQADVEVIDLSINEQGEMS